MWDSMPWPNHLRTLCQVPTVTTDEGYLLSFLSLRLKQYKCQDGFRPAVPLGIARF